MKRPFLAKAVRVAALWSAALCGSSAVQASVFHPPAAPDAASGLMSAEAADTVCPQQHPERLVCGLDYITEGRWNLQSGRGAWANRLDARLALKLWRGAQVEATLMGTYGAGREVAESYQDVSNINAPNRPLRLTHLGLQQQVGERVTLYAGVRQADEDYFDTPLAAQFTGASYGCLPTVADNFHINVYPFSALGLHVEYAPAAAWKFKGTLYNGIANDTFHRIFRFRPHADGLIHLGSVSFTPQPAADADRLPAVYSLGWNVGNHYRSEKGGRHTQAGLWAVAEQPLFSAGRVYCTAGATFAHEFNDPEVARTYWNAAAALGGLTRTGGILAFGVSRAYYHGGRETDVEAVYTHPFGAHFSVQPALHLLRTDGRSQTVASLRVNVSF